jgi:hypothetical protein
MDPVKILIVNHEDKVDVYAPCEIEPIAITWADIEEEVTFNESGYDVKDCEFHWDAKNTDFEIVRSQIIDNQVKYFSNQAKNIDLEIKKLVKKRDEINEALTKLKI